MALDDKPWPPQGPGRRRFSNDDMAAVLFFLRGAERDGVWFDGYSATEAFEAACRLMEIPPDGVRPALDGADKRKEGP